MDPAKDWVAYLARKQTYSDPAREQIVETMKVAATQIPYNEFVALTDDIRRDIESVTEFARKRAELEDSAKGIGRRR